MFKRAKPKTTLDEAIDQAVLVLKTSNPETNEYRAALDAVTKLSKVKAEEKPNRVSKDTVAIIAANLAGILLIIAHEHTGVVTSKALGLVLKPK